MWYSSRGKPTKAISVSVLDLTDAAREAYLFWAIFLSARVSNEEMRRSHDPVIVTLEVCMAARSMPTPQ